MSTLSEKLIANKAAILKQNDQVATREAGIRAANKKANDDYEKAKKDYDQAVAAQQAAAKKAAAQQAAAKKAAAKKAIELKTVNDKFDSQINALGAKPPRYIRKPKYYTNRYTGRTRLIGYTRERNYRATQNYNSAKARINRERNTSLQRVALKFSNIPAWAKQKASREFGNGSSFSKTSLTALAQRYAASKAAKAEFQRRSSVTTAKSQAVQARTATAKLVKELKSKKDSLGTLRAIVDPTRSKSMTIPKPKKFTAGEKEDSLTKTHTAQKRRPKVMQSSFFSEKQKTPVSIIGTTPALSDKAQQTFKSTQAQQKKLHKDITGATYYKQAIKFRETAQMKNPYVGTANSVYYKGGLIGSSGVLIEKKLNAEKLSVSDPSVEQPEAQQQKQIKNPVDIFPSMNVPKPEIQTSHYVPGSLGYIYQSGTDIENQRRAEEIRIASSGTYGDYLKTVDQNSIENQLKLVGKGATRGFNSYTSLVGFEIQSRYAGHSLIDLAFTDIYNSAYEPVIKPAAKGLKNLGINLDLNPPASKSPKPFELTSKAYNERTPAENFGDIVTVASIETGIALGTGGIGNLAIRGASKLPYLLKMTPKTPKQVIETAKAAEKESSRLVSVTMEDGSKVKLPNPEYAEPVKKPTTKKKIYPAPGISLKKIKLGGKIINVIDFDHVPKTVKDTTRTKKPAKSVFVNSKLGRLIGTNFPSTENLSKLKTRVKGSIPEKFDPVKSLETKFINNDFIRKTAQSKILNPKKKDKGKTPVESGTAYNKANSGGFPELPTPGKTATALKTEQQQILKILKTKKTKKVPGGKKPKQVQGNDSIDVISDVGLLHADRPKIKGIAGSKIGSRIGSNIDSKIGSKTGVGQSSMIDNLLKTSNPQKQQPKTKTKNPNKSKTKQEDSFSLLVTPGKQGSQDIQKQFAIPKPTTKQKAILTTRITQKAPTKRPPGPLKVFSFDNKPKKKSPGRKGRGAVKYSIWNVDTQNIGALPGAELEVSKSKGIFKKLDKRQRKAYEEEERKKSRSSNIKKKPTKKKTVKTTKKKRLV